MIHEHNWQRFKRFGRKEWRCTSAKTLHEVEKLSACSSGCIMSHPHYIETGCLGSLVYWKEIKTYLFGAPGLEMAPVEEMPRTMMIDSAYLVQCERFNERFSML